MATDLHPGRPAAAPKNYETFVESQLARARARIRLLDVSAAALGLLILTLAYGLIMALCDRRLEFSPLARQIAFAVYVAGALVYVGLLALRPLFQPINPYYAARRLEETIPEAKNSVVNWLDLHQQAIAPAFRSAISHQAARDLADADLEQAISARRTGWLGTGAAVLCVCMLVLFLLGPRQFLSLLNRAFAPFVEAPIATRTRLLLEQPEGGDVTIPIGKAVGFSVWVEGRVPEPSSPEAVKLLYRYNPSDPFQMRLLERGESSRQWLTNLLASEVHNGFYYKVAGGDAETLEYRVQVRSTPLVTGFDVTYHYRPYLGWQDRTTHEQNLQDLRGTEVTLVVRTNRTVKDGQLKIDGQQPIGAELVPADPQALRFHLRLESDGNYRIWFRSAAGERNNDPMPYTIRVLQDHPPQIELTKPGEDIPLPANGVLRLEGTASDDFGLTRLDLRMKLENGPALQPKPYRKGQALRRGDGSYPQMLAYRDFVELDKLHREDGRALEPLPPGAKIEYWLEGTDNCDYPGPNIGQSKEQRQHEQKQDHDLQNERKEAQDRQQGQQQARPADKEQTNEDKAQSNEEDLNKQKEKIENAIKKNEQQQKTGDKGESSGNQSQKSQGESQGKADQPQQSKGGGSSERPGGQAQNKGKDGGENKAQPSREKSSSKPEGNRENGQQTQEGQAGSQSQANQEKNERGQKSTGRQENGQQNREGQAGSQSEENHGKKERGQKSTGSQTRQGTTQGDKKQSEPASDQKNGSNQTGKSPEDSPKANDGGQAQNGAKSKSEKRDNSSSSHNAGEKGRDNPQARKEQSPAGGQEKGPNQGEGQNGTGTSAAKPDTGQTAGGEKPGKTGSAREGANQSAGQPKNEANSGANAKPNQNEHGVTQQSGQKKDEGTAGQRPERGQEHGGGEPRREKSGSSSSEGKTDQQSTTQSPGKADSGKRSSKEPNRGGKKKSDTSGSENGTKALEKAAGAEKRDTGTGAASKPEHNEKGHGAASQGKEGTNKAQDRNQANPGSGGDEKARTQQTNPEQLSTKRAGEKSKDNISSLSEALKGRDAKGRAEARMKLEELRDKAKDPAVRQAARAALEHAGQNNTDQASQKQNRTKPGGKGRPDEQTPSKSGEQPGKGQGNDQNNRARQQKEKGSGQSDAAKSDKSDANRAESKPDSRSATGERGNQAGAPKRPGGSGAAGSRGGSDPTAQKPEANGLPDKQPSREDSSEPPTTANAAYRKRAGELQLEDIKKKINKDVLKQLNMTEEDFQKFVKAYEEMLKRKQPSGPLKDNLIGPQRGNRSLPNQNVRRVVPQEPGKGGNLQRLDLSLAPPEFREAYREFSRKISELGQAKEKK